MREFLLVNVFLLIGMTYTIVYCQPDYNTNPSDGYMVEAMYEEDFQNVKKEGIVNPIFQYYSTIESATAFADSIRECKFVADIVKIPQGNTQKFMAVEFLYRNAQFTGVRYLYPYQMNSDYCRVDYFVQTNTTIAEFDAAIEALIHREMHVIYYTQFEEDSLLFFLNEYELKQWESKQAYSLNTVRLTGAISMCASQHEIDYGTKLFMDFETGIIKSFENHNFKRKEVEIILDLNTGSFKFLPLRFPPGRNH